MISLHKAIHSIFKFLFGDFNGVQVFLYPWTLLWWVRSESLLYSVTGLLTIHKHFFPLAIFCLLFLYMMFLIVKNSSAILKDGAASSAADRRSFWKMVIELHRILLLTVMGAVIIFALASFLRYYYNIRVPLKAIYPIIIQAYSVVLILFYTLKNVWTEPYRNRGDNMDKAYLKVGRQFRKDPKAFLLHASVLISMIFVGCFIYNLLIMNLLFMLVERFGIAPKLEMLAPTTIWALLYDIFVMAAAFMLSNLLFSPIVTLVNHFSGRFKPQPNITDESL